MPTDTERRPVEGDTGELSDRDLEAIAAGKGLGGPVVNDYHFGGLSPRGKMLARFLDNRSIRLVSA